MPARRSKPAFALALLALCAAASADPAPDYARLYASHDFFGLRAALVTDKSPASEQTRFYTAAMLTAFNQPLEANKLIDALLVKNIDTALMPDLLMMRMQNDRRLFDYDGALDAERTLVDVFERTGDARLKDAQNTLKLLVAMSDAKPQQTIRRGDSHIVLAADGKDRYCIPVTVGTDDPCYILDSGANYSVLIRSEAERLGLKVIRAGVDVGSSTSARVSADVAVAPLVLLGNLEYHDVVFLVMPDSAFSFKGFQIPGILGYQVFAGMGAVTTHRDHVVDVPKEVPAKRLDNIVFDGGDLLTQLLVDGQPVLCRLDTGAEHTVFYKPYYDAHKEQVEKARKTRAARTGGAGGIRTYLSYRLPELSVTLAGRSVTLKKVDVYTEKVVPQDYLMCNLGQDALKSFKSYTINLKAMSLTVD
jgi:predicted aspartyl protease